MTVRNECKPLNLKSNLKSPEHVPIEKNRDGSRETSRPSMTAVSSMKLPKDPHHSDSSYTMKILWPHSLGWKSPDVSVLGLNVATLGRTAANPVNTLSQGFQQSSIWINPFYRFGSRHLETLNTMRLHFCCMLSIAQQLDEGYRICILGVVSFLLSLTSVCLSSPTNTEPPHNKCYHQPPLLLTLPLSVYKQTILGDWRYSY